MILAAVTAVVTLAALVVGAWAIETRLAALWRTEQRRHNARHRRSQSAPR
ncbi:hypothetical protein [Streptomyces montanisoli]|uniref:Uncharacterized protein n=1 Tax=Streptomyces montanisoli TaxID=2798581 RepID=A0A940M502_9ACTN|nr:hypothetical protein [Streptomyces montanisoli]MBP0456224.1 hypothetical protein [Streptomyces montanisoli]